jgi:hypothetical protein
MATSATLKVRTPWVNPRRRRFNYFVGLRAVKSRFLVNERSFDPFAIEYERDEDALAFTVFIWRKVGQAVPAVHGFLDFQFHDKDSKVELMAASISAWYSFRVRLVRQ